MRCAQSLLFSMNHKETHFGFDFKTQFDLKWLQIFYNMDLGSSECKHKWYKHVRYIILYKHKHQPFKKNTALSGTHDTDNDIFLTSL